MCNLWLSLCYLCLLFKGVVIAWSSSLSVDIIVIAPNDIILVNKSGGGIKGLPMCRDKWWKMAKCLKIQFSGKRRENGVVIAWSSFFFTDIIATAPSEKFLDNTSRDGANRSPKSRHKWWKMAKNDKKKVFLGKRQENGKVLT